MKNSKNFILALLFSMGGTGLFAQTRSSCEEASMCEVVAGRIQKVESGLVSWVQTPDTIRWTLEERMALFNVNGLSIAVINDYKVEWAKAYGWADVEEGRRVDLKTLFQAASLSKSINGMGLMKLATDNKMDIENDDINRYLRSWKFPYDSVAGNEKISITDLLSHTAGLTVHGFSGYSIWDSIPSLPEILDGIPPANNRHVRSFTVPGEKVQYSGGGTTISQMIVEDVSGMPYEKYMGENVLGVLGMDNSTFAEAAGAGAAAGREVATGYYFDGNEVEGKYHIYPEKAAAGLWTTPVDLAKFIIEIQLAYAGRSGKVLSPEATRRMLTPVMENAALGTFVQQMGEWEYFAHSGSNRGFICQYYGTMEGGKGVVVMTNGSSSFLVNELVNSVAVAYGWEGFYNPEMRSSFTPSDPVLDSYVGSYVLGGGDNGYGGDRVTIFEKDGQLYLDLFVPCRIYFATEKDFLISVFHREYTFMFDDEGAVKGLTFDGNLYDKVE